MYKSCRLLEISSSLFVYGSIDFVFKKCDCSCLNSSTSLLQTLLRSPTLNPMLDRHRIEAFVHRCPCSPLSLFFTLSVSLSFPCIFFERIVPDKEEEQRSMNNNGGETCAKLRFQVPTKDVNTWLEDHKVTQRWNKGIHAFRVGSLCVLPATPNQQQNTERLHTCTRTSLIAPWPLATVNSREHIHRNVKCDWITPVKCIATTSRLALASCAQWCHSSPLCVSVKMPRLSLIR